MVTVVVKKTGATRVLNQGAQFKKRQESLEINNSGKKTVRMRHKSRPQPSYWGAELFFSLVQ